MMPVGMELSALSGGLCFPSCLFSFSPWSYWKDLAGVGSCKERGLLFKWDRGTSLKSDKSHSDCIQHCEGK